LFCGMKKMLYLRTENVIAMRKGLYIFGLLLLFVACTSGREVRYDELTFTLTFPTTREHIHDYAINMYNGENKPMKLTDDTYTASFKAKFKWVE